MSFNWNNTFGTNSLHELQLRFSANRLSATGKEFEACPLIEAERADEDFSLGSLIRKLSMTGLIGVVRKCSCNFLKIVCKLMGATKHLFAIYI